MIVTARSRIMLALLTSSAFVAMPALAQEAEETVSDEIIVTAQKREENLQDVPISVLALGTKKLDQLGISNFNDYTKQLPSVAFQTIQPGSTTVYIRGVASGGDGNHSGSLPSVGVYLDEQPVTTIGGTLDVHIYDIARIEALAGPQGTLYGASSQAGTIRILTNKPDTSGFSARVDGEVNKVTSGDVGGKIEAYVNVPFSDRVALRAVGWYTRAAGFIDNVLATRSFLPQPGGITVDNAPFVRRNFNEQDIYGGRIALKVDLNDNWTVTPTVIAQELKNRGRFGYDPAVGDLQANVFTNEFRNDRFVQAALTIEGRLGNWDLTYAGAYLDRNTSSFTDYTDYAEAYDSLYASSGGIADYFYFENAAGADIDPRQFINGSEDFTKLSQELRIASPQDAPVRFSAGLFYQRQGNHIFQEYQVSNLSPLLSVNGRPGVLWLTNQERVDKDYALFSEVAIDVTKKLTFTAGGRFYRYDNDLIGFFGFGRNPAFVQGADDNPPPNAAGSTRTGVAGCFTASGLTLRDAQLAGANTTLLPAVVPGTPCTNLADVVNGRLVPRRTTSEGFIHRLNLTYKPFDKILFYATSSRGFRPGGINRRASVPPYAADFLTNYEIGWKTELIDGFRFNGAVYRQDWKAFQFAFLGENSFTQIQNGPNARINGVEVDFSWKIINGLTLSGAGAYTDAKTRGILCSSATDTTPDCANSSVFAPRGIRLPITPKFKGNVIGRYEFPLVGGKANLQADIAYQSSASSDIRVSNASVLGRLRAFTTVDFSGGIDFDRWSLVLFGNNVFDVRGENSRYQQCGQCTRAYIVPTQPQTFGLRLGYKF